MSVELLISTLVVAVPFVGSLLVPVVYLLWKGSRISAWIGIVSSSICTLLVGWLWWTEAELAWRVGWIEPGGIGFGWRVDAFSLLFAVTVAGAALLTMIYSAAYLPRMVAVHRVRWNPAVYYAALLFFTGAMLGLALSEDLFQFYVFWELIDLASFVLIGLNWRNAESRRAALKALVITALGGLALLIAFVLLAAAAGTSSIPALLQGAGGTAIHADGLLVVLLGVAAATKSAQVPFHVWLPNAMAAPTPVNAFLDSAALVAAGVFLVVRFTPLFADSPLWMAMLVGMGGASMLVGGVLALRQRDLKWLLAYSTISMFGFIFVLAGLGEQATFAALWFLVQHAIVKAGLFFVCGLVEQRPLELPTAAQDQVPRAGWLLAFSGMLALSLVGVPPLAGFWMKEFFFEEILHAPAPAILLLVVVGVGAASLTLVYMLRFLRLAFFASREVHGNTLAPSAMWAIVAFLAVTTLLVGLFPEPISQWFVEPAAMAATGVPPQVDFAYHLDAKLLLSLLALSLGFVLFWWRERWQPWLAQRWQDGWSLDGVYRWMARSTVRLGRRLQRVQNGSLHRYLYVILIGSIGLIVIALPAFWQQPWYEPHAGMLLLFDRPGVLLASALLLLLIGVGTVLTLIVRTHLRIVLTLGTVGFLIAGLFGLLSAPNLGLVQVHVETLVTVLFVLILVRVPHQIRRVFEEQPTEQDWHWSRLLVAVFFGLTTAGLSWLAIEHQPSAPVAVWYNEQARELTGAEDVVDAILVYFRALDTLGEIVVFAIATLGVWVLVQRTGKESE